MKRILIVNADDCNLTPGVTKAILDCHDRGILTSTTFLINLPTDPKTISALKRRKKLGVGLHLNITLAKPVSDSKQIKSLLAPEGRFKKVHDQIFRLPKSEEVEIEYQNQIDRFVDYFGRLPTHLDTHHQVHDHPFFLDVLLSVAKRNKLPVRRSRLMLMSARNVGAAFMTPSMGRDESCPYNVHSVKTTHYFFGNLSPSGHWTDEALKTLIPNLPEGISEIMCHPGFVDKNLAAISSFTTGRDVEYHLFCSPDLRRLAERHSVHLRHFGLCYT